MQRKRYREAQIVSVLPQAEAGVTVAGVRRKLGIAEPAFYRWMKRYQGGGGSGD